MREPAFQIIQTTGGKVKGIETPYGFRFLGIPYAHAERFCKPEPFCWEGTWNCVNYGSIAPQLNNRGRRVGDNAYQPIGSENCQNLNVWTPGVEGEKKPVFVYIHGGALQRGSGNDPFYDGDRFREKANVVYVSVNMRLGVMGYLELGHLLGDKYKSSGNNGIRDVIAALQWIHDNIAAFGGDPSRVTLYGISAGAKTISTILMATEARTLFNQIFVESGSCQTLRTFDTAERVTANYLKYLDIQSPEELLTISVEKLMLAQSEYCNNDGSACYFGPIMDGELIHENWRDFWNQKGVWNGKAVLGSSYNEHGGYVVKDYFLKDKEYIIHELLGDCDEHAYAAFEKLSAEQPEMPETERWNRVLSDIMYRYYTEDMAALLTDCGVDTWLYNMEIKPGVHAMGNEIMLGNLAREKIIVDEYKMKLLSDHLKNRTISFVTDSTPNSDLMIEWPTFAENSKMIFDIPCHVESLDYHRAITGFPAYCYRLD